MKMKTFILIDRSGSMLMGWPEMTVAMAAFSKKIKKKMLVAMFDADRSMDFRVVHDGKAKDWDAAKSMGDNPPRGMTPLYDAIFALDMRLLQDKPEKAQIVVLTDGQENASREHNRDTTSKIVKGWEKKGFDVVWMGASFADVTAQSASLGLSGGKTVNMSNRDTYMGTMSAVASRNKSYASGQTSSSDQLEDDIREAADGKV